MQKIKSFFTDIKDYISCVVGNFILGYEEDEEDEYEDIYDDYY